MFFSSVLVKIIIQGTQLAPGVGDSVLGGLVQHGRVGVDQGTSAARVADVDRELVAQHHDLAGVVLVGVTILL